jgi:hypothetical protein
MTSDLPMPKRLLSARAAARFVAAPLRHHLEQHFAQTVIIQTGNGGTEMVRCEIHQKAAVALDVQQRKTQHGSRRHHAQAEAGDGRMTVFHL